MSKQHALYNTTPPTPDASVTIRICNGSQWHSVLLLQQGTGWVQVDDGNGPLWVMIDHVHHRDVATLRLIKRLREQRN
ncbi:MAG: hypothetical protein GY792_30485 [Gammaproteobacteria bacterium]|nr:hypothetical protein [Gammaproteobacteria bacterium]